MISTIAVLFLASPLAICDQVTPIVGDKPLVERLAMSVSLSNPSSYVGEPLSLKVVVEGIGDEDTPIYQDSLFGCFAEIQYRRVGGEWNTYTFPYAPDEDRHTSYGGIKPSVVRPGQSLTVMDVAIAVDGRSGSFVIPEPGQYEVRVIYSDSLNPRPAVQRTHLKEALVEGEKGIHLARATSFRTGGRGKLTSRTARVEVLAARRGDDEALAAYLTSDIGILAQSMPGEPYEIADNTLERAVALIERYPHSVYSRHLRKPVERSIGDLTARRARWPPSKAKAYQQLVDRFRASSDQ